MLLQLILAVSFAVCTSAFCSLLEAVLYSLSMSRIELLAETRPRTSAILKKLKESIDQPITAILTLNTIANTMGAAVAGAAAASVFGENNLIWFSVFFTLIILLISEILPKTIGVEFNGHLAPYIARPLQAMVVVLRPIILICQAVTDLIPKSSGSQVSADELTAIARMSRKSGEIERDQEKVITNIINLRNKTVRQVMTPRTVTFILNKDISVAQAALLTDKWRSHSRVPIYGSDINEVVGIVLSYEVMQAVAEGKVECRLEEIMQPIHFVPEIAPLNKVMLEFFEKSQHLFVVVDEYGSMTGVISLEDILEEIIGREIVDESDRTQNMRALARAARKKMTRQALGALSEQNEKKDNQRAHYKEVGKE
ncbi:MAG: CNNM domain-containing protein [Candidatus Electrothrix aestuarii]|uniref:CNNM domain-containing protein n=1 Tax=Candidatus Electrothrix aestuarii TaxID=3062594 RepID=A0AAU8LT19_9BACT|nr:CNNM domain-containing protein [Candidatus Electrothrix aestuarii]WPD21231.1 MAG: CNNM domain-containing protein [Candidatus Electrothrix sp. GW3-3]